MVAPDDLKRAAAEAALARVEDGMRLGLGTGSTAIHLVAGLGTRLREGRLSGIVCVPTSEATRVAAEREGLPLATLDEHPELDLVIDGADEIDPRLRLIKGGGGALLREKIVASAGWRMIVIADASKRVEALGAFPLPIEVVPFGLAATREAIGRAAARAGCAGPLRLRSAANGAPFATDGGHLILDAAFGVIPDPEALAASLAAVPGVVEHGLFLGLATGALLAEAHGDAVALLEMGRV